MKTINIVMGYPASGKTTYAKNLGFNGNITRINRDELGGKIVDLPVHITKAFNNGCDHVVLDNTFPTVAKRKLIIDVGKTLGISVNCYWLQTSLEESQLNACLRMLEFRGKILQPEDFRSEQSPNIFPIATLFKYRKDFEKPTKDEGFDILEKVKFKRVWGSEYKNKALIVDYDDTLRYSTGSCKWPEDVSHVAILENRQEKLIEYKNQGYFLLGVSNQSAIGKGRISHKIAQECYRKTNELLRLDIEYLYCPHHVPPVVCYCRKPQVGSGAYFIHKYKLNPAECIMVGDQKTDQTFAERCGFQFQYMTDFFGV